MSLDPLNFSNDEEFEKLGICKQLMLDLRPHILSRPTKVQKCCIPHILKGQSVLTASHSGSGKTIAFVLPILQRILEKPDQIFSILLAPTIEHVHRIRRQFDLLNPSMSIKIETEVRGYHRRFLESPNLPHLLLVTPKRLARYLITQQYSRSSLYVPLLVFDEADSLVDLRFNQDLLSILKKMSISKSAHQTLLFASTLTPTLEKLKNRITGNMYFFKAYGSSHITGTLSQYFLLMPAKIKEAYLDCLLNKLIGSTCQSLIVFVENNTTRGKLFLIIKELGFSVNKLHSKKRQIKGLRFPEEFMNNKEKILVVNCHNISHNTPNSRDAIINYDMPRTSKDYIRSIQASCHSMKNCHLYSFITPNELGYLYNTETSIGHKLSSFNLAKADLLSSILRVYKAKKTILTTTHL